KWTGPVIAALLSAVAVNLLAANLAPRAISWRVMRGIAQAAGGDNRAVHAPRADASARAIVRPSPDLLYSACVFNLRDRALRVQAPVPDSYFSIAGFAANTDNFFALNDSQLQADASGQKHFDLVITRAGLPVQAPAGARVIEAPGERGVILFRALIADDGKLAELRDRFQAQQDCAPL
ncbi:MAG TPA: DUF1254 domain-containing protein, partial [Nevskiaceae bacterium]|nr:DUF1254 domain-containing protein [Nevskiaceae bacterium]